MLAAGAYSTVSCLLNTFNTVAMYHPNKFIRIKQSLDELYKTRNFFIYETL